MPSGGLHIVFGSNQSDVVVVAAPKAKAAPQSAAQQAAWADARAQWARWGKSLLSDFRNGQCTDLAARSRPDVVERIYEQVWASADLHNDPNPTFPGMDARSWSGLARRAGLTVSDSPTVGALVVWQPGIEGADVPSGHIGVVTAVSGAIFTAREENVGKPYHYGVRTLSTSPVSGRTFILP